MEIFRKINGSATIDEMRRSNKCSGITMQAAYTKDGFFTINGIFSPIFIRGLSPLDLTLNIHLYSEKQLKEKEYSDVACGLMRLNKLAPVMILSSSQLSREVLNRIKSTAMRMNHALYPDASEEMIIASNDDIKDGSYEFEMMYSGKSKSNNKREYDRLAYYLDNEIPVLLDWPDNYNGRISKIIEKSEDSDCLYVVTETPKQLRKLVHQYHNGIDRK